jgi:hypothetical protein
VKGGEGEGKKKGNGYSNRCEKIHSSSASLISNRQFGGVLRKVSVNGR